MNTSDVTKRTALVGLDWKLPVYVKEDSNVQNVQVHPT